MTQEEYQLWSLEDTLPASLLAVIIEICHIVFGLKPNSPLEEGNIISGWLQRYGTVKYLVFNVIESNELNSLACSPFRETSTVQKYRELFDLFIKVLGVQKNGRF